MDCQEITKSISKIKQFQKEFDVLFGDKKYGKAYEEKYQIDQVILSLQVECIFRDKTYEGRIRHRDYLAKKFGYRWIDEFYDEKAAWAEKEMQGAIDLLAPNGEIIRRFEDVETMMPFKYGVAWIDFWRDDESGGSWWELIDVTGKTIKKVNSVNYNPGFRGDPYFMVREVEDGPIICIDRNGQPISNNHYGYAEGFSDGVAIASQEKISSLAREWLIVHPDGTERRFSGAPYEYRFSEGVLFVKRNGKYVLIDHEGAEIVKFTENASGWYDQVKPFSEGLAAVKESGFWVFVDKNGETLPRQFYDRAESFSEGLAVVEANDHYFYIDKKVEKAFGDKAFVEAKSFKNGFATVADEIGYWHIIDHNGDFVLDDKFVTKGPIYFENGLFTVYDIDGKIRYLDKNGNWVF